MIEGKNNSGYNKQFIYMVFYYKDDSSKIGEQVEISIGIWIELILSFFVRP